MNSKSTQQMKMNSESKQNCSRQQVVSSSQPATSISVIATLILFLLSATFSFAQNQTTQIDEFAKIGNKKQALRLHLLEEKVPEILPEKYLSFKDGKQGAFEPMDKINTPAELDKLMVELRKQFVPFMKDFAPKLEDTRNRIPLKSFSWREETETDLHDFNTVLTGNGEWTEVAIPHFGPPLGRAVTYYYKEFDLSEEMLALGSLFTCFKAVDYRAHIFVNGSFLGSHEGMFAPFELNFTKYARKGKNTLVVKVENDYTTHGGHDSKDNHVFGDKIYASTGLGYDDPVKGWHHCPPGMGITQDCYIEARNPIHFNNLFVRPLPNEEKVEIWVEVNNFHEFPKDAKFEFSIYGQNFEETVVEGIEYFPHTTYVPGVGDMAKPLDWQEQKLQLGYSVNYFKIPVDIKDPKIWNNDHPWLYQLQAKVFDENGKQTDAQKVQFGMRTFTMDTESIPKGMMYLNGEKVRLRGANSMGYMQQSVFTNDMEQLIDDILLAKACNMNFIRLTQRPVQPEIYDFADKLGLMLQTDLPLFGSMRPNQFIEGVKQAEEMERLVRNHPCNIMVTYINERFPNAEGKPHRCMATAEEFMLFFKACDQAVLTANPDRVIKAGDGDYDPPSPGLPDNHCYNAWYNGHGLGLGKLHQGYWQMVKPDWYYACGEFGSEGLDSRNIMEKYYPKEWLPKNAADEKNWHPGMIASAQTFRFHYMWFNTQNSIDDWIENSQTHQEWSTRLYTEAFRRDKNMVSFAIHLFIDAWPAGWMKCIMDVDRQPKKAFFAYRDALEPLMTCLRTDRHNFTSGEKISCEAWVCNDLNDKGDAKSLKYQFEKNGKVLKTGNLNPEIPINSSAFQGFINFDAPKVSKRTKYKLRLALFDKNDKSISESTIDIEVFPARKSSNNSVFCATDDNDGEEIIEDLGLKVAKNTSNADVILIEDIEYYNTNKSAIDKQVENGMSVVFLELPVGDHVIGGDSVSVVSTVMGQYFFASPNLKHPVMKGVEPMDFKFWYDEDEKGVMPFLGSMAFTSDKWTPIVTTGQSTWQVLGNAAIAVAEMKKGKGEYRICQIQLNGKLKTNPVARQFARRLLQ